MLSSLKEDQTQNTVKKLILSNVCPWDSKQNTFKLRKDRKNEAKTLLDCLLMKRIDTPYQKINDADIK